MPNYKQLNYDDYKHTCSYSMDELLQKHYCKAYLNSLYGRQASVFKVTFGKGEKMNRDKFLVVHQDGKPILINKEYIVAVSPYLNTSKFNTDIETVNGAPSSIIVDEDYGTVVKKLFA